jgi:RNA 3'-terminal phosphate cyclase (ATP)
LQTILPALWFADGASEVYVRGGTHNKAAPPADFLIRAWAPLVASMGVLQELVLERHGFYPAGGGQMSAYVRPIRALHKLSLNDRGALRAMRAIAVYADLPRSIGEREVARAANAWPTIVQEVHEVHRATCPGNAFFVQLDHESVSEVFSGFGEVGIRAESVADHSIGAAQSYLASDAAVGGYLADQLLLPMAIAGSGEFTTTHASSHLRTNIAVIEKFLALEISVEEAHTRVRVRIQR